LQKTLEEAGLPVARRRRRFPRLIIDRETTINDGDFSAQRRDYADTMRFQTADEDRARLPSQLGLTAAQLLTRPSRKYPNPVLERLITRHMRICRAENASFTQEPEPEANQAVGQVAPNFPALLPIDDFANEEMVHSGFHVPVPGEEGNVEDVRDKSAQSHQSITNTSFSISAVGNSRLNHSSKDSFHLPNPVESTVIQPQQPNLPTVAEVSVEASQRESRATQSGRFGSTEFSSSMAGMRKSSSHVPVDRLPPIAANTSSSDNLSTSEQLLDRIEELSRVRT